MSSIIKIKLNVMKSLLYVPVLLLLLFSGCRKERLEPVNYDVDNKIFRVRISSKNDQPFDVTVNRVEQDASLNFTVIQTAASGAAKDEGKPFEFAYTPTAGTTININVESKEDLLTAYVFYKGSETWKVYMQKKSDGIYRGTFSYKVTD